MIFEDDPKPTVQETAVLNSKSVTAQIISFGADKSYVLNSLQRMKSSTICEIRKNLIDHFITEYLASFSGFVENQGFDTFSENYRISPVYARQSYEKVINEQEYLNRIMSTLNGEQLNNI
ncbi:hypothetical protein ASG31_06015 [Chryseobacterium sp. Leaf404]|uniref:hypothetical protein n=1 Tax=unclassified Chryseobacterium TaxID=2593645 RepID=UPI0006F66013|nr:MULTISPECIES: hypothetical protein [unclassified Chryseobacterium]KQT18280.1 hypothetical protein ASG31_06015 [Chryseobacterium sp. Leaf404]